MKTGTTLFVNHFLYRLPSVYSVVSIGRELDRVLTADLVLVADIAEAEAA